MLSLITIPLLLAAQLAAAKLSVDVSLARGSGAGTVLATVTNTGDKLVSLFRPGSILSDLPTETVSLFGVNGTRHEFEGIRAYYNIEHAGAAAWEQLAVGANVTREIDLTQIYGLKTAGMHSVHAADFFQALEGAYSADKLANQTMLRYNIGMKLDVTKDEFRAVQGARTQKQQHQKRMQFGGGCDNVDNANVIRDALNEVQRVARIAAGWAVQGGPRWDKTFKSSNQDDRNFVAGIFNQIGDNAGIQDQSPLIANCGGGDACSQQGVVAYVTNNNLFECDYFWQQPPATVGCSWPDGKADILMHELSHLFGIQDLGYGIQAVLDSDIQTALHNADTYRFYSRALANDCQF